VPYNPHQNSVIETWNCTVVAIAKSMLKVKGHLGWFWGEVMSTIVYVLNRGLTKSVDDITSFEP
jgi:hypothetical protein